MKVKFNGHPQRVNIVTGPDAERACRINIQPRIHGVRPAK